MGSVLDFAIPIPSPSPEKQLFFQEVTICRRGLLTKAGKICSLGGKKMPVLEAGRCGKEGRRGAGRRVSGDMNREAATGLRLIPGRRRLIYEVAFKSWLTVHPEVSKGES